jgi:hypothetical protein
MWTKKFHSRIESGQRPMVVVVTATSYVGGYWFGLSVPLAFLLRMGLWD